MTGKFFIFVLLIGVIGIPRADAKKKKEEPTIDVSWYEKTLATNIKKMQDRTYVMVATPPPVYVNFAYLELHDYDRDGIPDQYDLCPSTPGVYNRRGCPELDIRKTVTFAKQKMRMSKEDFAVAVDAFNKISFDNAQNLDPGTIVYLEDFVSLLKQHKDWNLSVSSHFDESKSTKENKLASEKRLNAVCGYMQKKGINKKRITGSSYGDSRPVVDLPPTRFEVELDFKN